MCCEIRAPYFLSTSEQSKFMHTLTKQREREQSNVCVCRIFEFFPHF